MIVVVLVLDAVDQTLLATFTEVDTSETGSYQSVDKALDIYYLSIAYLAAMRNWTSDAAFRIAQFLFYYRLVGVVLFELTDERLMLLLFPNTFEYFFIAYELARLRYEPARISAGSGCSSPRDYGSSSSSRRSTGSTSRSWTSPTRSATTRSSGSPSCSRCSSRRSCSPASCIPRLPAPDWSWRLRADPLPASLDEAHERYAHRLERGRVLTREALEQVWLLALLCIIFASILPGIDATVLQVAVGVTAIVLANAAISLAAARRAGFGLQSAAAGYAALLATNLVLVYVANALLGERRDFDLGHGLFFAFLITTIIWLYDAFRPVYDLRFADSPLRVRSIADLLDRARERRP